MDTKLNPEFVRYVLEHPDCDDCPQCGRPINVFWQTLNPVLVSCLLKIVQHVQNTRTPYFDKKDIAFTNTEYGNMPKLRYFGLIAKHKVNGAWEKGKWVLTPLGSDFLRGKVRITSKVATVFNQGIDKSPEMVLVTDVMAKRPEFITYYEHYLKETV